MLEVSELSDDNVPTDSLNIRHRSFLTDHGLQTSPQLLDNLVQNFHNLGLVRPTSLKVVFNLPCKQGLSVSAGS